MGARLPCGLTLTFYRDLLLWAQVAHKGEGTYRLEGIGVAAHAGTMPDHGRSAGVQLAQHVLALHALDGQIDGVRVNVGVAHGGERPNTIPGAAHVIIDVRACPRCRRSCPQQRATSH